MERKPRKQISLLILLLAAAFLRFWHIGWGLPEIYEEATPYSIAWKMWRWGGAGLDLNIRIRRAGTGEPLLLIPRIGAPQRWQRMIGPLTDSYDLIVPDLPGFGESECPRRPFRDRDYAEVLSHLAGGAVNVVGISYGGQIVAAFGRIYRSGSRA